MTLEPGTTSSLRDILRRADRAARLGVVTGLVVALIDGVDALTGKFSGSRVPLGLYALVLDVFVIGVTSAAVGAWWAFASRVASRIGRGRLRGWLSAALASLPFTAFVLWVPTGWIVEHFGELGTLGRALSVLTYPFLSAAVVVAARIFSRIAAAYPGGALPRPRLLRGLTGALAAALYLADRSILTGLYDDFHVGLCGGFVGMTALSVGLVGRGAVLSVPRSDRFRALEHWARGALIAAAVVLLALELVRPNVFGPSRSLVFGKLVPAMRSLLDLDRDGVARVLGGSDCDDFDADTYPGKLDFPGNEKDEDCSGTSARWPGPLPEPRVQVPNLTGSNLLLITIDALRADHLGAYGYDRNTSPAIDALAATSLRFTAAFAPAPKTYETFPAMMTGLYPTNLPRDYEHPILEEINRSWVQRKGAAKASPWYYVTEDVELLGEVMSRKGYRTMRFSTSNALDGLGMNRGFGVSKHMPRAIEAGIDALERESIGAAGDKPFFLWLYDASPHDPYEAHAGHDFGTRTKDLYDSEIAHVDAQLGRAMERYFELGLDRTTILILTADHGEEFGDHGGKFHSLKLHRELLHVPLIMRIPGFPAAAVKGPVELVDLAPTLCELLRLRESCDGYDGQSLVPVIAGRARNPAGAYAEISRRRGVLRRSLNTGGYRLIQDIERDRVELYDLRQDPQEQRDVAAEHPAVVAKLLERATARAQLRQTRLLGRYVATKDTGKLAYALDELTHPDLVRFALDELEKDLDRRFAPALLKLSRRRSLAPELTERAASLARRAAGE